MIFIHYYMVSQLEIKKQIKIQKIYKFKKKKKFHMFYIILNKEKDNNFKYSHSQIKQIY